MNLVLIAIQALAVSLFAIIGAQDSGKADTACPVNKPVAERNCTE